MPTGEHWMERANCANADPHIFDNRTDVASQPFGAANDRHTGRDWDQARAICAKCTVHWECFRQVMALDATQHIEFFAAGLTPRELRAMHRRRTGRKKSA